MGPDLPRDELALIDEFRELRKEEIMPDGREIVGDVAFGREKRLLARSEDASDLALTAIEAIAAESVGVGMSREVEIESFSQQPVKQEIDKALFPREDIQSAMFAAEIAMKRDAGAEGEGFALERAME